MKTYVTITWSIFFVHMFKLYAGSLPGPSVQSDHYTIFADIQMDPEKITAAKSVGSIIHCAQTCMSESTLGTCTIATYNKTSKMCSLSSAAATSLVYTSSPSIRNISVLFPRKDCDPAALPSVANGYYTEGYVPGWYQLECDANYQLYNSTQPNLVVCDVDAKWLVPTHSCVARDQTRYADGRNFVTAFLKNFDNTGLTLNLYIIPADDQQPSAFSTVSIEAPYVAYSETFVLSDPLQVEIPVGMIDERADISISNVITIKSLSSIYVYSINSHQYSTGGFLVLPVQSLYTRYMVAARPYPNMYSTFMIISIDDSTVNVAYPDKSTDTIILNAGETYQIVRLDVSGTYVESDKDIAVLSGEWCANLPNPGNYSCDQTIEQMPPIEALDNLYIVAEMEPRSAFILHIVAAVDNTQIVLQDANASVLYSGILHKGDTFTEFYDKLPLLSVGSDNPVLVTQYGVSASVDEELYGDPAMFVVPGVNRYMNEYRFYVPDGFDISKVMMFFNTTESVNGTSADPRNGLTHNGQNVSISKVSTIQLYQVYQYMEFGVLYLDVTPGVHHIQHPVFSFGAILYGQKQYNEYAWNLGMYMWNT